MCQNLWTFYRSTPLGGEDSPNFRQLLYCTAVLLVESLFEYMKKIDPLCFQAPNQGKILFVIMCSLTIDFVSFLQRLRETMRLYYLYVPFSHLWTVV